MTSLRIRFVNPQLENNQIQSYFLYMLKHQQSPQDPYYSTGVALLCMLKKLYG